MNTTKDFSALKRKVYLAYHQDGILDLVAGSVVAGFGLNMLTGNIAFLMFGWMAMMLYVLFKQRITIPRFGFVGFESRERTLRKGWLMLAFGLLILVAFIGGYVSLEGRNASPEMQSWSQQYHMVPLSALLFGLPALVAAVFLGLKRFFVYFLLAVALPALGAWMNIETYLPILISGLVMLSAGAWLLTRFLKKYPLEEKADDHAKG